MERFRVLKRPQRVLVGDMFKLVETFTDNCVVTVKYDGFQVKLRKHEGEMLAYTKNNGLIKDNLKKWTALLHHVNQQVIPAVWDYMDDEETLAIEVWCTNDSWKGKSALQPLFQNNTDGMKFHSTIFFSSNPKSELHKNLMLDAIKSPHVSVAKKLTTRAAIWKALEEEEGIVVTYTPDLAKPREFFVFKCKNDYVRVAALRLLAASTRNKVGINILDTFWLGTEKDGELFPLVLLEYADIFGDVPPGDGKAFIDVKDVQDRRVVTRGVMAKVINSLNTCFLTPATAREFGPTSVRLEGGVRMGCRDDKSSLAFSDDVMVFLSKSVQVVIAFNDVSIIGEHPDTITKSCYRDHYDRVRFQAARAIQVGGPMPYCWNDNHRKLLGVFTGISPWEGLVEVAVKRITRGDNLQRAYTLLMGGMRQPMHHEILEWRNPFCEVEYQLRRAPRPL